MALKISTIVIGYDRLEFIETCLQGINAASKYVEFEIEIILVSDKPIEIVLDNCRLINLVENCPGEKFNKSYLLNRGIERASSSDLISIIDVDMLVSPAYFNAVTAALVRSNFLIVNGHKLTADFGCKTYDKAREYAVSHPGSLIIRNPGDYPSQIVFRRELIELFRNVFGHTNIFDERLYGWGAEDCLILRMARHLEKIKYIIIAKIDNLWYHRYHEDLKTGQNRQLYMKICREIDRQFNKFISSRI